MTALEEAKQRLPLLDLMAQLGLSEHAKKSAKCAFHDDRNNSFSVFQGEDGEWLWKCFAGCGGGDAVELLARVENLSNPDACRRYIELAGGLPNDCSQSRPIKKTPKAETRREAANYILSDEECAAALVMAEALIQDSELCERISRSRSWRAETIRNLACEPSLGWDKEKNSLAFLYESGVKLRKRNESGERVIRWACGKPWIWRGGFLPQASTVYLCEGETDAISLIDAGVESALSTLAVALPSASTFEEHWARLFAGKDVILALDADDAGQKATERVSQLLRPHVRTLKRLKWEGLQHAC